MTPTGAPTHLISAVPPLPSAPSAPNRHELHNGAAYFDFGDANLTTQARQEIRREVAELKAAGVTEIKTVTGHADGVGSNNYNRGLSLRRAQAVAEELRKDLPIPLTQPPTTHSMG